MLVDGRPHRTIWLGDDGATVHAIDQRALPHAFSSVALRTLEDAAFAIEEMVVRGAPLIGATAAFGMALALAQDPSDAGVAAAAARLGRTRPTAVNLRWGIERVRMAVLAARVDDRARLAYAVASEICDDDVAISDAIGRHGLALLRDLAERKPAGAPLEVLTHCNAGWLAAIDWGTALAPIYKAHVAGLPVHVWVDETRPRNQGASLTAFELREQGVPHTVIADNVGGHLMQAGRVDVCIVGTDRTTAEGDVANKIGTYLKALAAFDTGVPFYVALPSTTIDWTIRDALREIPIEERGPEEVTHVRGRTRDGRIEEVQVTPDGTPAANYAFDVTPARLVTKLITERGVCAASREGLAGLFPERALRAPDA